MNFLILGSECGRADSMDIVSLQWAREIWRKQTAGVDKTVAAASVPLFQYKGPRNPERQHFGSLLTASGKEPPLAFGSFCRVLLPWRTCSLADNGREADLSSQLCSPQQCQCTLRALLTAICSSLFLLLDHSLQSKSLCVVTASHTLHFCRSSNFTFSFFTLFLSLVLCWVLLSKQTLEFSKISWAAFFQSVTF